MNVCLASQCMACLKINVIWGNQNLIKFDMFCAFKVTVTGRIRELRGSNGKVEVLHSTFPTSNAKSLVCDTANEHALECTIVCMLSNGTNGDQSWAVFKYIVFKHCI